MEGSTMSFRQWVRPVLDSWRSIHLQRTHGTLRNLSATLLALLATGQNQYVVATGHNPYLPSSPPLYSKIYAGEYIFTA